MPGLRSSGELMSTQSNTSCRGCALLNLHQHECILQQEAFSEAIVSFYRVDINLAGVRTRVRQTLHAQTT